MTSHLHGLGSDTVLYLCLFVRQVIELPLKHPELFEALGIAQPKVSHVVGKHDLPGMPLTRHRKTVLAVRGVQLVCCWNI